MEMTIRSVDVGWEVYNGGMWYYLVGNPEDSYTVYDDLNEEGDFGKELYSSYDFESCLVWIQNS